MYPSDIQPPLGGLGCMASAMRHVGRLAEGYCQSSQQPGQTGTSAARPPRRDPPKHHGDRVTATAKRATGSE